MAKEKHFKETVGTFDGFPMIGEIIKSARQKRARIWTTILVIVGALLAIVGASLFTVLDSIVVPIILLVVGLVILILTIIVSSISASRRKKLDLRALGQARFQKDIASIEEEVNKVREKKGNKNPFEKMKSLDRLIYLSKHLHSVKYHAMPTRAHNFTVTLDDGSSYPIMLLSYHYYDDYVLDQYFVYLIRNSYERTHKDEAK
ncbi:MAG: hypothetical protein LUD22_00015 [Coprobacillus sp.]|nr:hypothetical protein [Coprobacillus sp.]